MPSCYHRHVSYLRLLSPYSLQGRTLADVLLANLTCLTRDCVPGSDAPDALRGMLEEALQRLREGLERSNAATSGWQVRREHR